MEVAAFRAGIESEPFTLTLLVVLWKRMELPKVVLLVQRGIKFAVPAPATLFEDAVVRNCAAENGRGIRHRWCMLRPAHQCRQSCDEQQPHVGSRVSWIHAAKVSRREHYGFLVESPGGRNDGALGGGKCSLGESCAHQTDCILHVPVLRRLGALDVEKEFR